MASGVNIADIANTFSSRSNLITKFGNYNVLSYVSSKYRYSLDYIHEYRYSRNIDIHVSLYNTMSYLRCVNYKKWVSKIENLVSKICKSAKNLKRTIHFINFDKKCKLHSKSKIYFKNSKKKKSLIIFHFFTCPERSRPQKSNECFEEKFSQQKS